MFVPYGLYNVGIAEDYLTAGFSRLRTIARVLRSALQRQGRSGNWGSITRCFMTPDTACPFTRHVVDVSTLALNRAVFRVQGRLYALRDACPHMGAPLSEGKLTGGRVVCGWHGWSFDLTTGRTERGRGCARVHVVERRGERVYVHPAQRLDAGGADDEND